MMVLFQLAVVLYVGVFQFTTAEAGNKRVCYYTNWSQYRKGAGKFTPGDIPSGLCTHLIYAFAKLEGTEITTIEANDELLYKEFTGLKGGNPSMKTMIAIGGWTAGSVSFSNMAATLSSRTSFIKSVIKFLRTHNFDGLDIDWEYPAARGGKPEDKANLALLLMEMREAFSLESSDSGKDMLLISVAVAAAKGKVDNGYDVTTIGMNVDFINLMTYDLHGSWDRKTGENSPLFARDEETGMAAMLNTAWAANYWASEGAPRDKIIVGMSFNGQTFTLESPTNSGVGAPSSGPGAAGQFTGQAGTMAYYETCKMLETGGSEHWNREQHVPYYVNGDLWVGYDNIRSVSDKAKWIKEQGFGGAMVWSLESDDFKQVCSSSKRAYPLLSAINDALGGTTPPVVVDTTVASTSTAASSTPTVTPTTPIASPAQTTMRMIIETSTASKTAATSATLEAKTDAATSTQTSMTSTANSSTQQPVTTQSKQSQQPITSTSQPSTQQPITSTAQPSTHKQMTSTAKPTTQQPTTSKAKQSTHNPSTENPSTQSPSTAKPSTQSPSTAKPSTQSPSTAKTSTQSPSTAKPSTQSPSTAKTSTQSPSTAKPSTQSPSTANPTTQNPSTAKPSTQSPSTAKPNTQNQTPEQRTSTMSLTDSTVAPTRAQKVSKQTTSPPSPSATTTPQVLKPAPFSCASHADGFYSDPAECARFYRCYSGSSFSFDCPPGTVYNAKISVCDWPYNVKCN